jgi:hypothetical protein
MNVAHICTHRFSGELLVITAFTCSARSCHSAKIADDLKKAIMMRSNLLPGIMIQLGMFLIIPILGSCNAISPVKPQSGPTPMASPTDAPINCSTPLATNSIPTQPATLSPSDTQTGVCIDGRVALNDGSGLANVRIYISLAAYAGEIIATTDSNGDFRSGLKFIPGDENVTVWAELEGYIFNPPNYHWRHYHGLELRTLHFTADFSN